MEIRESAVNRVCFSCRKGSEHTVSLTIWAVRHGTVLFSTMIAPGLACCAISAVTASNAVMSVAHPLPAPRVLVGVLTEIKTTSASEMHRPTWVLKTRLGCLAGTTISRPVNDISGKASVFSI